ncbi:MAG: methyltransferase domain-containing protein [Acidobacteria bacterium]|nr:MAG: methyltransferase domain-containing protein [Acidobacteriota bacterium]
MRWDNPWTPHANLCEMRCPVCTGESVVEGVRLGGYDIEGCIRCGLRFAPKAFAVETDYDAVYDSRAYIKEQVRPMSVAKARERFPDVATYRAFFDHVPLSPGKRLLDVGCGVGRFLYAAHLRGWQVEGIDRSQRAIDLGKTYAAYPMRAGSVGDIVEAGRLFDVVTLFEVLEHLADPVVMLKRCKMLLRGGGSVFVTVPNWGCSSVHKTSNPAELPPIHLLFFGEGSLRMAASEAGLKVLETGYIDSSMVAGAVNRWRAVSWARWAATRVLKRGERTSGLWMLAEPAG